MRYRPRLISLSLNLTIVGLLAVNCGSETQKRPAVTRDTGSPTSPDETVVTDAAAPVVVLGDSIGRGMFVRYNLGQTIQKSDTEALINGIPIDKLMSGDTSGIMLAFDQSTFVDPNYNGYSGTGGSALGSFKSLVKRMGLTGTVFNESLVGATSSDTEAQLTKLVAKMGTVSPSEVKRVIYALGNNDFCSMSGSMNADDIKTTFRANYLAELKKVTTKFPKASIYVVSPLSSTKLQTVTSGKTVDLSGINDLDPMITPFVNTLLGDPPTCSKLIALYCPSAVASDGATLMTAFQIAIKGAVQDLAASLTSDSTRSVYYADLSTDNYTEDMLAADCFHPNVTGQNMLATGAQERFQKLTSSTLLLSEEE